MTVRDPDEPKWGPEAGAFIALTRRVAALELAALVALAFPLAGLDASLALVVGGGLTGIAHAWLCKGLGELLRSGASGQSGRLWAASAMVPRQALLAVAFFVAILPLALPPAWLLVGVTAWPVAFVVAACLSARLPAAALAASARPASEI